MGLEFYDIHVHFILVDVVLRILKCMYITIQLHNYIYCHIWITSILAWNLPEN